MAVYERTYKTYQGSFTSEWSRFLILPRYVLESVFSSRMFLAFFVGCYIPSLVLLVVIYLTHNAKILQLLSIRPEDVMIVDGPLFMTFLAIQGLFLGFVLAVIVGPALISSDLRHNALPMFFSRPFSRTEYVAGKMCVLVLLLSAITWIPNLLLFLLQAYLSGWEWTGERLHIPFAIFVGSWVWILTLSLVSLAVSAVFKRKMSARVFMFVVVTILGTFGGIVGEFLGLWWGHNLNVVQMTAVIWASMFHAPLPTDTPVWSAWATMIVVCGLCLVVLARKIRAYEVVR